MLITFPSALHARVDSRARFKNGTAARANLVFVQFVPLTFFPFYPALFPARARGFPAPLVFFNHATSLKKSTGTAHAAKRGQLIGLIAIVLHERLLQFSLRFFYTRLLSATSCNQ